MACGLFINEVFEAGMMRLTIAVPKIKHLKVLNPHVNVRGKGWASSSMRMMPLKGVHSKSCLVVHEALSLKLGGRKGKVGGLVHSHWHLQLKQTFLWVKLIWSMVACANSQNNQRFSTFMYLVIKESQEVDSQTIKLTVVLSDTSQFKSWCEFYFSPSTILYCWQQNKLFLYDMLHIATEPTYISINSIPKICFLICLA